MRWHGVCRRPLCAALSHKAIDFTVCTEVFLIGVMPTATAASVLARRYGAHTAALWRSYIAGGHNHRRQYHLRYRYHRRPGRSV